MSGILNLAQFHLLTLGVVLLIGVAAGRWMFARPTAAKPSPEDQAQP